MTRPIKTGLLSRLKKVAIRLMRREYLRAGLVIFLAVAAALVVVNRLPSTWAQPAVILPTATRALELDWYGTATSGTGQFALAASSAANTAQTITKSVPVSGYTVFITTVCIGARGAATTPALVKISQIGFGVDLWYAELPANGVTFCENFNPPLSAAANTITGGIFNGGAGLSLTLTVPAGGVSVITDATLIGYTRNLALGP